MAYYRTPAAKSPAPWKNELLLAVGWRAFVNHPHSKGERATPVPLSPTGTNAAVNDLSDGQEVEVLAWRPAATGGLSYQIKRLSDGSEFWLRALYLRKGKDVPSKAA